MSNLPDWFAQITFEQAFGFIAVLSTLAGVIVLLMKILKPLSIFLRQWNGIEEVRDASDSVVVEGKPGIGARIKAIETDLKTVHHEVTPNHGGSMKDQLTRAEQVSKETAAKVAELELKLEQHIKISKEKDLEQESTAKKLDQHMQETGKWTGMLTEMHDKYMKGGRQS